MRDKPNCKICTLKCYGCSNYNTCGMRQNLNGSSVEDCTSIASEYYLFNQYLNNPIMQLCNYQDVCKTVVEAWL